MDTDYVHPNCRVYYYSWVLPIPDVCMNTACRMLIGCEVMFGGCIYVHTQLTVFASPLLRPGIGMKCPISSQLLVVVLTVFHLYCGVEIIWFVPSVINMFCKYELQLSLVTLHYFLLNSLHRLLTYTACLLAQVFCACRLLTCARLIVEHCVLCVCALLHP